MITILASTGRILARHWPALLAWLLAGVLGRMVMLNIASFVGGRTAIGGLLLLPLASLASLVSMVGVFLVIRTSLRELSQIAPQPEEPAERRRVFMASLLSSILPFLAVYAASGMLDDDKLAYARGALDVRNGLVFGATLEEQSAAADAAAVPSETVLTVSFSPITISIIVLAFAMRWALKKWSEKLPKFFSLIAVYCEVVWIAFSILLLQGAINSVTNWVEHRAAVVWVEGVRSWLAGQVAVLGALWDALEWLLTQVTGLIGQPLAWLTVAGVIYGQAVAAQKIELRVRALKRARERASRLPEFVQNRGKELGEQIGARFVPIWNAIVLMWRAGPVFIGSYVLLYCIAVALEPLLGWGITRVIGPHDIQTFWYIVIGLVSMVVSVVAECIRIPLVAASYDRTIGSLRNQPVASEAPQSHPSTPESSP